MAGGVLELRLRPLGRLSFKPPQPFGAGIHGPGSIGSTLSYPMPSTIAGLLAGVAYRSGCKPSRRPGPGEPFADTEECLDQALGGAARIYTGLLAAPLAGGERLHAYLNTGEMPPLQPSKCLDTHLNPEKGKCGEPPKECEPVRAERHRVIGISLRRGSKSVAESLFYSLEYFTYKPQGTSILALIAGAEKSPGLEGPVKLGAKTGIAIAKTTQLGKAKEETVEGGPYRALLISPALLQRGLEGPLLLSSVGTAERLAGLLLEEAGLEGRGRAVRVPRGEYELGVTSPGWSMLQGVPRPPLLVVPPGTLITGLTLERPVQAVRLGERILLAGLGCCSRLGWGTALLVSESAGGDGR